MVALPTGILASGFSDKLNRRRAEYQSKVDEFLVDGLMSKAEESELEVLRKRLNLDRKSADQLIKAYMGQTVKTTKLCPHCGKSFTAGYSLSFRF